ncbi:MAG: sirohydrochlorin cobaltochelatase, partial [Myxococcales bacterium]|nr:sirohydrochlorin cobaltochelatase [Myxococcales bacterium]
MRALLLVDHGSRRADANETLEQMSALLRERLGGAQAEVRVAFAHMELASPSLPEAFESLAEAGATQIVIVPYMLTPGRHAIEDIPRIAAECAARHPGL